MLFLGQLSWKFVKEHLSKGLRYKLLAIPFRKPDFALLVLVWANLFGFVLQDLVRTSIKRIFVGSQHCYEV